MPTTTSSSAQAARPINYAILTEVIILGGTAVLFLAKWSRGNLSFYIHPRYTALVLIAALALLLMAAVRLRGVLTVPRSEARLNWLHLMLAVPLLMGVLVPARPLGADTLAGRGLDLSVLPVAANQDDLLTGDPSAWNLLQWSTAVNLLGGELHEQPIDVVGFVYQDARLPAHSFYVARYVITCCAADGAAVALSVQWQNGEQLPPDSWVRVRGTLLVEDGAAGAPATIAATTVEPIEQPDVPYLFP
ncbi:MAG: TIGR03943 family protein [Chloroflexaceae bacterium]|nr:TIGR03943 family protein [Chloroflexaceae bacterium]NJO06254.1 TIGR03943 family protein [Chloroflexaceae bacterium]